MSEPTYPVSLTAAQLMLASSVLQLPAPRPTVDQRIELQHIAEKMLDALRGSA